MHTASESKSNGRARNINHTKDKGAQQKDLFIAQPNINC